MDCNLHCPALIGFGEIPRASWDSKLSTSIAPIVTIGRGRTSHLLCRRQTYYFLKESFLTCYGREASAPKRPAELGAKDHGKGSRGCCHAVKTGMLLKNWPRRELGVLYRDFGTFGIDSEACRSLPAVRRFSRLPKIH